ncbi:MAG: MFS transporter [Candidatus Binatota bacterium]
MADDRHSFTRSELGPVLMVSLIISLRLLGIFLMLPVFSVFAVRYPGATLPLAGIAFGVYPLTQSFLQIPLGWASDRWGRKPLILFGLLLFTVGSLICGFARDIVELIVARAIQGSGAIASVALAALADLTRPSVRAQAFTVTGIVIGATFMLGLLSGPVLAARIGFNEMFYLLAFMGVIAMLITGLFFPSMTPPKQESLGSGLRAVLQNRELRLIYLASFVLSFTLNMFFFVYPLSWTELGLQKSELWKVYLIIFFPSVLLGFPSVRYAEKRGRLWLLSRISWLLIAVGYLAYLVGATQEWLLYISGGTFFIGYTVFQPLLPSFLTQRVALQGRGAATGCYNFSGFLGAALGGMLGGILSHVAYSLPQTVGLVLLVAWWLRGLPNPPDSPL